MLELWRDYRRHIILFLLFLSVSFYIWHLPRQKQWVLNITLIGTTFSGNLDETRKLLDRGSDVNARHDNNGMTPLMCAAWGDASVKNPGQVVCDHPGVVKLLLERGASVKARDNDGKTALHHAAEHGQDAIAKILIDAGADVTARDAAGRTPLQWAEMGKHDKTIAVLKEAGAKQ
jgi:ankyrin repeat protein